jgi:hypothetical protein
MVGIAGVLCIITCVCVKVCKTTYRGRVLERPDPSIVIEPWRPTVFQPAQPSNINASITFTNSYFCQYMKIVWTFPNEFMHNVKIHYTIQIFTFSKINSYGDCGGSRLNPNPNYSFSPSREPWLLHPQFLSKIVDSCNVQYLTKSNVHLHSKGQWKRVTWWVAVKKLFRATVKKLSIINAYTHPSLNRFAYCEWASQEINIQWQCTHYSFVFSFKFLIKTFSQI